MDHSVLLIEDETEIRELMKASLEMEGFEVFEAENGDGILEKIGGLKPSILFVDQILPGRPGLEIIKEVRGNNTFSRLPIIMVTGCDSEEEKVQALSAGADDYVTKPFSRRELIARARAILRRVEVVGENKNQVLTNGNLRIDLDSHRVSIDQTEIPLTLTEFRILCELLNYNGRVLSRAELCDRVLGRSNVTDRTIDVHVAALRKKLSVRGDDIQTVRGVGYRFSC